MGLRHGTATPAEGETPETHAQAFCGGETGVADTAAALEGAGEIVIERLSEDAALRQHVRTSFFDDGYVRTRKGKAEKGEGERASRSTTAYRKRVSELKPQKLAPLPGHAPQVDGGGAGADVGRPATTG